MSVVTSRFARLIYIHNGATTLSDTRRGRARADYVSLFRTSSRKGQMSSRLKDFERATLFGAVTGRGSLRRDKRDPTERTRKTIVLLRRCYPMNAQYII